ncbi:MAG: hypothetical protein P1U87_22495 [Verrucomicrobiales bacterium]|nr:hypothetical protein [Verrucomicrobiales bacterium]
MIQFLQKRPWIWVVVAFTILIGGWIFLLRLAAEHRPDSVEIITIPVHERAES